MFIWLDNTTSSTIVSVRRVSKYQAEKVLQISISAIQRIITRESLVYPQGGMHLRKEVPLMPFHALFSYERIYEGKNYEVSV